MELGVAIVVDFGIEDRRMQSSILKSRCGHARMRTSSSSELAFSLEIISQDSSEVPHWS